MSPDAAGYRFACDWLKKKKTDLVFWFYIYIHIFSVKKGVYKKETKNKHGERGSLIFPL